MRILIFAWSFGFDLSNGGQHHACADQEARGKKKIGDGITITVIEAKGNKIRLGIDAPDDVTIFRAELLNLLARIGTESDQPAGREPAGAC